MKFTMLLAAAALWMSVAASSQVSSRGTFPPGIGSSSELPLAFVENQGQWETPARFIARRGPFVARAEPGALVVQLERRDEQGTGEVLVARLEFEGARESLELVGEGLQPGVRNYFVGDREHCRAGVRAWSKVLYRGIHDGIDLRLREHAGRLEYDLLLEPDAELERFVVRCEGVDGLSIEEDGSLVMETSMGPIRHSSPETWHVLPDGERRGIESRFVLLGERRFGFALEERLPGLPVVIDPGLEWATYLGGSADDACMGVRVDPSGRVVTAGWTFSNDFPLVSGLLQGTYDAYFAVLDPSLSGSAQLIWVTLIGGSQQDRFWDMEVDAAGNVFGVGSTLSDDLPCTPDAFDPSHNGVWDAFVSEVDGQTGLPSYLSYFGGGAVDSGARLEVEEPRVVTISGATLSSNLDMIGSYQSTKAGGVDYYVARLDLNQQPAVNQLTYSSYLGGSSADGVKEIDSLDAEVWHQGLDLLSSGEIAITGRTTSHDYPTKNAYDSTWDPPMDAILTILDPSVPGSGGLVYSTYLCGSGYEAGLAIEVDESGVVTLGGSTTSVDFPITAGAFDSTGSTQPFTSDAFLLRLDPGELLPVDQLLYSTYLGAEGYDGITTLRCEADGCVLVGGYTGSAGMTNSSFPTTCGAWDESFNGEQDTFVAYLDLSKSGVSALRYATFVGGADFDGLWAMDLVPGLVPTVVCGCDTFSTNLPTENPLQASKQGGLDAFLFQLEINPHTYCVAAPNSVNPDGALICATGSVCTYLNTFTLGVSGAIPNQAGLFYFGPNAIEVPFGHGVRCAGGGITRLSPALSTDATGSASRWIDFWSSPGDQLTLGTAWHFQFWYRDPAAGGAAFNYSNALKAVFYP